MGPWNHRVKQLAFLLVAGAALTSAGCDKSATASVKGKTSKSVDAKVVFTDKVSARLAEAAADGDAAKIDALVKGGANPSAIGDKSTSMLQWAMLNRSPSGMAALLDEGADVGHADDNGNTIVHYAAKANDGAYLDILLAHKVDPNMVNTITGGTPLMAALFGERHDQLQKLLAAGANVNLADRMGNTPLHVAAKINENQAALDLLRAGTDPRAVNKQGFTFQRYLNMTPVKVLSADARRQRESVMAWLRDHGVPIEAAPAAPATAH